MKLLPKVLSRDKKQQGFRLRTDLIDFLEKFVDEERKNGNIISKNDVIESLLNDLRDKDNEKTN